MPTTLTLENVPDELYRRLEVSAAAPRRSLNDEAIVCLESVLTPGQIDVAERLARARALRASLGLKRVEAREIDRLERAGRR